MPQLPAGRPHDGPVTASPAPEQARLRRTAGDRRAQLVQIGLELLPMTQEGTRGQPLALRAGVAALLLFLCGLCAGVPFPALITARDVQGRIVTSWSGSVPLTATAVSGGTDNSTVVITALVVLRNTSGAVG